MGNISDAQRSRCGLGCVSPSKSFIQDRPGILVFMGTSPWALTRKSARAMTSTKPG